jgi:hypothetical protein
VIGRTDGILSLRISVARVQTNLTVAAELEGSILKVSTYKFLVLDIQHTFTHLGDWWPHADTSVIYSFRLEFYCAQYITQTFVFSKMSCLLLLLSPTDCYEADTINNYNISRSRIPLKAILGL